MAKTIVGKFLKKAGTAAKKAAKVVIPAAVGIGGAALGLGAISPTLATKVSGALNKMGGAGKIVNKVVQTGVVMNDKIKDTFKKNGADLNEKEVNEVSKAIADKATQETSKIITRVPETPKLKKGFLGIGTGKRAATRDAKKAAQETAKKIEEQANAKAVHLQLKAINEARKAGDNNLSRKLEQLEPRKAARYITEPNEADYLNEKPAVKSAKIDLEKTVAKATVITDMLQNVVGEDTKAGQAIESLNNLIGMAPEVAARTKEVFTSQNVSPKFNGEDVEFPEEAQTQILKQDANKASINPFAGFTWKPVYWVYLGVGIAAAYMFKTLFNK